MTLASESNRTNTRRVHRCNPPIVDGQRQAAEMGGAVSSSRNDVDPRFQRVADLAASIEGLSELTQTMILSRVEAKKQSVDRRQSGPAKDSETTSVLTPQPESVSSASEFHSAPERMTRIEHLLKALRRAYGAINKFMAAGGSNDEVDADRESMR